MPTSQIVSREKVALYTESFGKSDGTPVLLIAGAMAPAIFWDGSFCDTLALKGYRVLRFDNRDIGRSTHFPQSAPDSGIGLPYSIEDMVDDAAAVLAHYSDGAAHIVGHSLGGSIAQLFNVRYPQQTLSLTAVSNPILAKGELSYVETAPEITEELWQVLLRNHMYQDYARGAGEFLKVWRYLNGDWELDEAMADEYTRALYQTEKIGPAYNHTNVQSGIVDIIGELASLDNPVLFVHGEKDYLAANPENVKTLAGYLPNADLYIISGGGHMFFNKPLWRILASVIGNNLAKAEPPASEEGVRTTLRENKTVLYILVGIGVLFLAYAFLGNYIALPGYLRFLERGRTSVGGAAFDTSVLIGTIKTVLWMFSFQLGVFFTLLGTLRGLPVGKSLFIATIVGGLLWLGVAGIPSLPGGTPFFAVTGFIVLVLIFLVLVFWYRNERRAARPFSAPAYYRVLGYVFFALAAWDVCGLGTTGRILHLDMAVAADTQGLIVTQTTKIMLESLLAWGFTFLGQFLQYRRA